MVVGFFFALRGVLASEVGYSGKRSIEDGLLPILRYVLSPTSLPMCSSWNAFFLSRRQGSLHSPEVRTPLLLPVFDHSTPPLLGSRHGMGSVGFRRSCWHFFGSGSRFRLHISRVSLQVFRRSVSVFTTYLLPAEVVNGYQGCSVARIVSSRRRIGGWTMELIDNHECLWDSSQMCVRKKEHLEGIQNLLCRDLHLLWLDFCICGCIGNGLRVRGLVKVSRAGFGGRFGLNSERTRFKRSSWSIRARSRALRFIALDVDSGQVLSFFFRWITSELNCIDKGSRFYHDPSKLHLHVLAQRFIRSSPARTCGQDSFFFLVDWPGYW